jgi:peroxiredoxin family protein
MSEINEPIRKISIICSKGSLDMAYPGLILANAARMSGIETMLFFTFWGLDIVTKGKADHLHLSLVGNTSVPVPAMLAGLPGVEALASVAMRNEMEKLDIPPVPEFIQMLSDAGAELYACGLAMDMFRRKREQLMPQVQDVISAVDFYDKAAGSQIIFI